MSTSVSGSAVRQLVLLRGGARSGQSPEPDAEADAGPNDERSPTDERSTCDVQVVSALMRGDPGAPYQAWLRFRPMVRGNLRRIVGPGLDEEDLGQEVFLRFFQRVGSLREPAAVRGFLFAICLRVAQKELRRRWLRRWLRLTNDGTLPDPTPTGRPDDTADREVHDAVTRYYAILDAVGGQGRSLFVTRYIEGMELTEVARTHGLSVSTTQRRLGRVAKRIDAMVRRDPVLAGIAGPDGDGSP
ncbi:MAG: sigma-70 family RNA polymerase sigma factor [Deltaproteobacteria bacterium]|nr:sigma-70 family RNA polymerase sigma factor [Deltaproteobacteria bacterium]